MLKSILTLSAAALLLGTSAQAQSRQRVGTVAANRGGGYGDHGYGGHGDYRHGGDHGHYYYFGGVPYFYPFYDIGFGYPGYAYDYGIGGPGYGYPPYGDGAYDGRIVDQSGGGQNAPSLPTVVQQQLAKRGFYKGTIDGKFGPASRSALSRFQHENGLQETGRIDEPTLMALGFANHR